MGAPYREIDEWICRWGVRPAIPLHRSAPAHHATPGAQGAGGLVPGRQAGVPRAGRGGAREHGEIAPALDLPRWREGAAVVGPRGDVHEGATRWRHRGGTLDGAATAVAAVSPAAQLAPTQDGAAVALADREADEGPGGDGGRPRGERDGPAAVGHVERGLADLPADQRPVAPDGAGIVPHRHRQVLSGGRGLAGGTPAVERAVGVQAHPAVRVDAERLEGPWWRRRRARRDPTGSPAADRATLDRAGGLSVRGGGAERACPGLRPVAGPPAARRRGPGDSRRQHQSKRGPAPPASRAHVASPGA
jgi:hypothetical protein